MKANNTQLSLVITTLALAINTSFSQSASAATLYSVLDLGVVSGIDTVDAIDVNDLGQVLGESGNIEDGPITFRTVPNRPINPATDIVEVRADDVTFSKDLNNSGQVVGIILGGSRTTSGFITEPNGLITTGLFPIQEVVAINNLGQAIGSSSFCISFDCRIRGSEPIRINPDGTTSSLFALDREAANGRLSGGAINDLGQVATSSYRSAPNSQINPETDDIGSLGGGGTSGLDINNLGQVVGSSTTTSGETRAFRTTANSAINLETDDLGTLGGNDSVANAINELGQVVGYSELANGDVRAFLFDENTMFDLNDLVAGDVDFTFTEAVGINESGQIAVNGFFGNDSQNSRAFLLTPVPEPTSMLGVLAFGAGAGILRRRAKRV
ncbi:PEP-CTERM sorting domain-containing protein [Aliterella atlantica]|uniref:PEP-CTERM protein-sorting domain-containing protein n=1 Tax=Aliterella atlantica CENA595 TaxID=1618023 RepID=A0A0D8ZX28_9CYAN|nr:PEP-CTERM sorting domain-containing protein [Aliterella atlantica]KJH71766.1 hypothetical protein UH38_10240 [Aliterella atlantica CENA595]